MNKQLAHVCNHSYLGGNDQEYHSLRLAQVKKIHKTPSQPIKAECGGAACHSAMMEA
jgi:hypothetical protein